jgi:DNA-directed RNA polymerase subunit M/transcription elongation factor TFIIS
MVMRKDTLTPAELKYVLKLGLECPNCHGMDNLYTEGRVQTDDGNAWQSIDCGSCGATWVDTYTLTGFTDLDLTHVKEIAHA